MSGIIFSTDIQGTPSWQLVRDGKKTQTWRINGDRFTVGKIYAYQPGRGEKAVGRILITKVVPCMPKMLLDADIRAEGFLGVYPRGDFFKVLLAIYPKRNVVTMPGYSVHFDLVEDET